METTIATTKKIIAIPTQYVNFITRTGDGNFNQGIIQIVRMTYELERDMFTPEQLEQDAIASIDTTATQSRRRQNYAAALSEVESLTKTAEETAVSTGAVAVEEQGKALIFEYSEKSYAIFGDTRSIKERIRDLGGYAISRAANYHNAFCWGLSKKSVEKAGGLDKVIEVLSATGIQISIGESVWDGTPAEQPTATVQPSAPEPTAVEQPAAPEPTAVEQPATVIEQPAVVIEQPATVTEQPAATIQCECVEPAKNEREHVKTLRTLSRHASHPDLFTAYFSKNDKTAVYVCIGNDSETGNPLCVMIGSQQGRAEQLEPAFVTVAQLGLYEALRQSALTARRHHAWAFGYVTNKMGTFMELYKLAS